MRPTLYEFAGGDEAFLALARAHHARCLADPELNHPFSHADGHPRHVERLAAYWAEVLGGPTTYSGSMGDESHVVRLHTGNGPHDEMDRRAIACFDQALEGVGLAADAPLGQALHDYFAWATTTAMAGFPRSADDVPDGLTIGRWSWDGLEG